MLYIFRYFLALNAFLLIGNTLIAKPHAKPSSPLISEVQMHEEERQICPNCCPPDLCDANCPLQSFICNDSRLRIQRLITAAINACSVKTKFLCADQATINNLEAVKVQTDYILSQTAQVKDICAENAYITNFCTDNLTISNLCADDMSNCTKLKAHLVMTFTQLYVLGDPIDFDTIVADPNNNILTGPTRYVVPRTGYYIATLEVHSTDLTGENIIAGIPVASLELWVNNVPAKRSIQAFLSFIPAQRHAFSTIIHLTAGDVLTAHTNVLVPNTSTGGPEEYVGSETLIGPEFPDIESTSLQIHYLSSDCDTTCTTTTTPPTCMPCRPFDQDPIRPCNPHWENVATCCIPTC